MNKTHLVWGSKHVIDIQNKMYWAQHQSLRYTYNVMFDIEEQEFLTETYSFLTQIRLNQLCMTPLMPSCRNILINMSWLIVPNAIEKSTYTTTVLCYLMMNKHNQEIKSLHPMYSKYCGSQTDLSVHNIKYCSILGKSPVAHTIIFQTFLSRRVTWK